MSVSIDNVSEKFGQLQKDLTTMSETSEAHRQNDAIERERERNEAATERNKERANEEKRREPARAVDRQERADEREAEKN